MSYRSIYAYPWDLAEEGVDTAVAEFLSLGLNAVTVAGSYHAGKFLRPHGRTGKVYFPEDGTVYFRADPSRYGRIAPIANARLATQDVFAELAGSGLVATHAWLVLLHNTPLGLRHPEATVRNAFGDRYPYSLCPSSPDARAYAVALVGDVTQTYPVAGACVESPGFAPYVHGFHHEFALERPNRWLENLLGLCFCDHCRAGAAAKGIDVARLANLVCDDIGSFFAADLDFPPDMAEAFWLADIAANGDLRRYADHRAAVVTSLVSEIRAGMRPDAQLAVIPSVARPTAGAWYEGSDLAGLAATAGIIEACLYEPGAERVRADLFDVQRRLRGKGRLRAIVRPSYPDLGSQQDVIEVLAILEAAGVEDFAFYNWGHLRRRSLAWIGEALRGLA